ncbi:MAG TPA: amidohydrolase [Rhodanobacteraceae bacterium]|nr:amidohydrolase [Rhodanobacteraceae bacterium]
MHAKRIRQSVGLAIIAALCAVLPPSIAHGTSVLVRNVNGYTLDASGKLQRFEALLASDGKVVATGTAGELTARDASARSVDGGGRTLLPGLIDAHGHVMGLGFLNTQLDLTATKSLPDALAATKRYSAQHAQAVWIRGRGWNQAIWKLGRFPTAHELDAATGNRPAWLERVDGHAGWANSAVLKAAGIDQATKDPPGGRIERDARGVPTGVLVDGAMELIDRIVPPPNATESAAALDASLATMARVGLTGVADAGIDAPTFALYKKYADARKLTARIYAMIGDTGADFDALSKDGPVSGYGDDFLALRAVKLYADGALGSRGAALLAPYSDDPKNAGLLFHAPAEMTAMIAKALGKGYQVCIHAIGDRGNREVLDAFAAAYQQVGSGEQRRNRVEHAQVIAVEDIPRFVALKLIASMQPTHATSDMNMAEDRIGADRLKGAYAWRTFLDQGTVVAGGSDFPVESPNPFFGIHAAVTRQDHANRPPGGWRPDQKMTLLEAFRAFTLDAAYAQHQEQTLGTLEPGKWADFIVVDRDIFAIAPEKIWSTAVLETWVGGKRVYAAKPAARDAN